MMQSATASLRLLHDRVRSRSKRVRVSDKWPAEPDRAVLLS